MSKKIITQTEPIVLQFIKPEDIDIDVSEYPIQDDRPEMLIHPDLTIEVPMVEQPIEEVVVEPTIYDKYEKLLRTYEDGSIYLTYDSAMEILRYCESKVFSKISLNMSCQNCMFDLVKMFKNLKEK